MREGQKIRTARRLRKDANAPEAVAWDTLRALRKYGFAVRRQHPISRFIADFAIVKSKIVIEIDGGVHRLASVQALDAERDTQLAALGWRVLRVTPETAMSKDRFMALIQQELGL